jgi:FkbM family methyltransferase
MLKANEMLNRWSHYCKVLGAHGAAGSVVGKLLGHPLTMAFHVSDLPHSLYMRVPSSDADAYQQVFLDEQYRFDVRRSPEIIVDAGANIGLASVYFSNRYPSARVFAIECEQQNFELLRRNVEPYKNIVPIHAALWNHDGEVEVTDPGLGSWGFIAAEKSSSSTASSSVPSLTLDSVMRRHGISRIDVLKIDIEGAELEVFDASASWIDKVDAIIVELHDRLKPGCERSFAQATTSFSERWRRGENLYVANNQGCMVSTG